MQPLQERVYAQLRTPRQLVGLETQHRALTDLLEAGMRDNQSTSVLCLGRPGTGKTACVDSVLATLTRKATVRVVRLTGHLHAEPRVGLREVLKQLGDFAENEPKKKTAMEDEIITELLARLQRSAHQGTPIVLLLFSFERFAAQPRQTLLYSLLELTHAAAAVLLIGITSAFDALDQLEKRVRSRFSQRHILFLGPKTVEDIKRIAASALIVEQSVEGAGAWNRACQLLLDSKEAAEVLQLHLQHTNDVRHFLNLLSLALTHTSTGPPTVEALQLASRTILADEKAHFLRSLSLAEMVILVVFNNLRRQGVARINFELVWQHVLRPQEMLGSFWELQDKSTMLRVLERLVQLGVFRYSPSSARTLPPSYRLLQLQASDLQVQALLKDSANEEVATQLRAWSR